VVELRDAQFVDALVELVRRASTSLPDRQVVALEQAMAREEEGSMAKKVLGHILENTMLAKERGVPICEDTGMPVFLVRHPCEMSPKSLEARIREAVTRATAAGLLRPNAIHPVSGENTGDGIGEGFPTIHLEEWKEDIVCIELLLKGGGSENVSTQYSLPNEELGADRDLEGVRRCVIDAIWKAQGLGCPPGMVGVAIGGDRASGMMRALHALIRRPGGDHNLDPRLAELEARLVTDINALGIGPLGLGGRNTVLEVRIDVAHRVPASYFVSIAYMCWATRTGTLTIDARGVRYS